MSNICPRQNYLVSRMLGEAYEAREDYRYFREVDKEAERQVIEGIIKTNGDPEDCPL